MPPELDVEAMLSRFRERAKAVRQRGLPPLEGPERQRFLDQARIGYMDYALIGDASALLDNGILTLTIDLRPRGQVGAPHDPPDSAQGTSGAPPGTEPA
ncbi:MAG: hypothetical protein ACP5VR_02140 [Acidimicrobiales bacterium]